MSSAYRIELICMLPRGREGKSERRRFGRSSMKQGVKEGT